MRITAAVSNLPTLSSMVSKGMKRWQESWHGICSECPRSTSDGTPKTNEIALNRGISDFDPTSCCWSMLRITGCRASSPANDDFWELQHSIIRSYIEVTLLWTFFLYGVLTVSRGKHGDQTICLDSTDPANLLCDTHGGANKLLR